MTMIHPDAQHTAVASATVEFSLGHLLGDQAPAFQLEILSGDAFAHYRLGHADAVVVPCDPTRLLEWRLRNEDGYPVPCYLKGDDPLLYYVGSPAGPRSVNYAGMLSIKPA